jgi:predicted Zn-dependent peptidase
MNYKKTILENGLRLITVPMKDNPTVTVLVLVEAGSKYESKEKNGISLKFQLSSVLVLESLL